MNPAPATTHPPRPPAAGVRRFPEPEIQAGPKPAHRRHGRAKS
jgi:hypothetical protein